MKVYAALYCDCVHESAYAPLSLHTTRAGAQRAVRAHKAAERAAWEERRKAALAEGFRPSRFAEFEAWAVQPMEVIDDALATAYLAPGVGAS